MARKEIQVWDPLIRIFHWMLVACFMAAYFLEDEFIHLHLLTGSIVLGLVAFRLIWGVAGTRHARFADFTPSLSGVMEHLRSIARLSPSRHTGHTPAGGVMIYLLLACLLLLTVSGVALYGLEEGGGPLTFIVNDAPYEAGILIKDAHGLIADAIACLVLFHVAGVFVESLMQRQNLVAAMITGRKYLTQKEKSA